MATAAPGTEDYEDDFRKFTNVLKIIPTCQGFFKEKGNLLPSTANWKKCVIHELAAQLPTAVQGNDEPHDTFFNCRKRVFKQCLSIIDFCRNVTEVQDQVLEGLHKTIFNLVEQHPQTGNIDGISSYVLLGLRLLESTDWDEFDKWTCSKSKKYLEQLLKDLKTFRTESDHLLAITDKLQAAASNVFIHGPYANVDSLMSQARRRLPQPTPAPTPLKNQRKLELCQILTIGVNESQGPDIIGILPGFDDPKLGLTRTNELILGDGLVKIWSLSRTLRFGLLVMVLQHIRHLLTTSAHQFKRAKEILRLATPPKKWTALITMDLTAFELAILRKSNGLLTKSTLEFSKLTQSFKDRTKALYELRLPFKVLKKNLLDTSYVSPIERHCIMFQVPLEESRLKKYIQVDCLNENAAKFIIRNFGERKLE